MTGRFLGLLTIALLSITHTVGVERPSDPFFALMSPNVHVSVLLSALAIWAFVASFKSSSKHRLPILAQGAAGLALILTVLISLFFVQTSYYLTEYISMLDLLVILESGVILVLAALTTEVPAARPVKWNFKFHMPKLRLHFPQTKPTDRLIQSTGS